MPARLIFGPFAINVPYAWFRFATRFSGKQDVIGAEFFKQLAVTLRASFAGKGTDAGLIEDFDVLRSARFDPARVHPAIRRFYEHTTGHDVALEVWWNPLLRPIAYLYRKWIARPMRQFAIPLDSAVNLDSWLELLDIDHDGKSDIRAWIRIDGNPNNPIYVGAYKVYSSEVDGEQRSYISVAFPVPFGNLTTVLAPTNLDGDGLQLSTDDAGSSEAGMYRIFPGRRAFAMTPGFGLRELFQLRPTADGKGVDVVHTCFWLFLCCFRMGYRIREKRARDEKHVLAFCNALRRGEQSPPDATSPDSAAQQST